MKKVLLFMLMIGLSQAVFSQYKIDYEKVGLEVRDGKVLFPFDDVMLVSDSVKYFDMYRPVAPVLEDVEAFKAETRAWEKTCLRSYFSEEMLEVIRDRVKAKGSDAVICQVNMSFDREGKIYFLTISWDLEVYEKLGWQQVNALFDKIKATKIPFAGRYAWGEEAIKALGVNAPGLSQLGAGYVFDPGEWFAEDGKALDSENEKTID